MKRKRKRDYDSQSRRAGTAELKGEILRAAKKLFTERGVDHVTVGALAKKAGVASSTVYALFQSKAGILRAIIEGTFFGGRYATLAEKTKTTADPIELLKITASISRTIFDTEKAEIGIMRGTSMFSPELRRIEVEFEEIRYLLQEQRAKLLVSKFVASRNLGLAKVRDVMWMYTGRDIYRMFVLEKGWTSDAYEKWLADTLIHVLTTTMPASGADRPHDGGEAT